MMMQWGVDLMDSLFLPGWVEASPEGNALYKAFGFREFEKIGAAEMPGMSMIRAVRGGGIIGGKRSS